MDRSMAQAPAQCGKDLGQSAEDALAEQLGAAADAARSAVASAPDDPDRALQLRQVVREQLRLLTTGPALEWSPFLAEIGEAAGELRAGDMQAAEIRLRTHLRSFPRDTAAMRLMALIALRSGFAENAERILRRAQDYEPDSIETVLALAAVLRRQSRLEDALLEIDTALPGSNHVGLRLLRGSLLLLLGKADDAEAVFEKLVRDAPLEKAAWVNLGYLSASVGKLGRAVAAYRTAVAIDPALGAGWLGIANLKRARLHDEDIEAMLSISRTAPRRPSRSTHRQIGFTAMASITTIRILKRRRRDFATA
jgi:tetratricopeptide (TPR) repeat protein